PLPVLLDLLTPAGSRKIPSLGRAPDSDRIVAITDWLIGHPRGVQHRNCLKRSLVLYRQLRKIGIPVEMCLGVRRSSLELAPRTFGTPLHGHAWLARGDKVLYEESSRLLSAYAETYRYPPPTSDVTES
ncbi:MAG: lasso peptide biosynthesis B2 protein, partial [Burkholderiales bacterium]|nr:lasso peptide biosynthesis B2 protein [Burkholderiales bacterium]